MERRMAPSDEEGKEIVAKGKALYDAQIRAHVETMENLGNPLYLDVDTGEYIIADQNDREDQIAKGDAMIARKPNIRMYGIRIGYPAMGKMGGGGGKWKPTIGGKPVVFDK